MNALRTIGIPLFLLILLPAGWKLTAPAETSETSAFSEINDFQTALVLDSVYLKNAGRLRDLPASIDRPVIANWNIERGYDPDVIAGYLESTGADIICLQEVDWNNERTGSLDILGVLAERLGMVGFFGIEFYELESHLRSDKLKGGGVHGNAFLTRVRPDSVYRVELPQFFDWDDPLPGTSRRTRSEKRIGRRFSLCADFTFNGKLTTVCTVHFENENSGVAGRLASLDSLLSGLPNRERLVIGGDLNTFDNRIARLMGFSKRATRLEVCASLSECDCWKEKLLAVRDLDAPFECREWTYRKMLYRAKLDWMLLRGLRASDQGIGAFNSSDHKPLWIRLDE